MIRIVFIAYFCLMVNGSFAQNVNNKTITKELSLLTIKNDNLKNILCQVNNQLNKSKDSLKWNLANIIVIEQGDSLYIQIVATNKIYNQAIFSSDIQTLYGYFLCNSRLFYVSTYTNNIVTNIEKLFARTTQQNLFTATSSNFYVVEENPIWFYLYTKGKIKLVRTTNLELLKQK